MSEVTEQGLVWAMQAVRLAQAVLRPHAGALTLIALDRRRPESQRLAAQRGRDLCGADPPPER